MNKYLIFLPLIILTGCKTPFFRSTQGVLTNVGISVPNSDVASFQIASYLSGQQVTVKEPSTIKYSWKIAETNNYFWAIETTSYRSGEIQVDGK